MKRLFSNVRGLSSGSRRGASLRGSRLSIEALEDRRMMAPVYYHDGHETIGGGFVTTDNYYPEVVGIHIVGSEGRDVVRVTEANGTIEVFFQYEGTQGGRYWYASGEVPHIFFDGFGGDDEFTSNSAAISYVNGGEDNDTLMGGSGEVHIFGGGGNDTIGAGYVAYGEFYGGAGNDTIYGTRRDDTLFGEGGNDKLYGMGGHDTLHGGAGRDELWGGEDNDFLSGGPGNDKLYGENGSDILIGGWVADSEYVDDDRLYGGGGYDALYGGNGSDYLDGGDDSIEDYVAGEGGADTFQENVIGINISEEYFADFSEAAGDRLSFFGAAELVTTNGGTSGFAPSIRRSFGAAFEETIGAMRAPDITARYQATPYEEALDYATLVNELAAILSPEAVELWTIVETSEFQEEQARSQYADFLAGVGTEQAHLVDEGMLSFLDDKFGWLDVVLEETAAGPDNAYTELLEQSAEGVDLGWVDQAFGNESVAELYDGASLADVVDDSALSGLAGAFEELYGDGELADEYAAFDPADELAELPAGYDGSVWDEALAGVDPSTVESAVETVAGYDLEWETEAAGNVDVGPLYDSLGGWGDGSAVVNPVGNAGNYGNSAASVYYGGTSPWGF
jgi:hypothetical protein